MAEFCLDCWNRINKRKDPESKYVFSRYPDFCEGCGQMKKVIIYERGYSSEIPSYITAPFELLYLLLKWIVLLPFRLYQYIKKKRAGK